MGSVWNEIYQEAHIRGCLVQSQRSDIAISCCCFYVVPQASENEHLFP